MTGQAEQAETVAFLSRLASQPPVETHISHVFLGQDTVWKLKKAIRLPFLDFTTLESRHRYCLRELELNAPAAPGMYRDVVPVVRHRDGSLGINETPPHGDHNVIDWVVRMARVPAGDFLDVRARESGLSASLLDETADAIAAFHGGLPAIANVRPDMEGITRGNTRSAQSAGLPGETVNAWQNAMLPALTSLDTWRTARAGTGFIRRCHGDLHLGNLCIWRGKPVPFDALEFDEALAVIDVAYDLAFLLMDMEHRIDRAAANRVLNRYIARTGDTGLLPGLPVFLSMRAMVRAHVKARTGQTDEAGQYLKAALGDLAQSAPIVIAIGGLQGTGKSTLARNLAPALGCAPGAVILRSDEIRKRQHGAAPEQHLGAEAYTPESSTTVFGELTRMIEAGAAGGHAVIADATFLNLDHRAMVEAAAARARVPFLGIWLVAPFAVLEARVVAREKGAPDASDATIGVLRRAFANDPGPGTWHEVDAVDMTAAAGAVHGLVDGLV